LEKRVKKLISFSLNAGKKIINGKDIKVNRKEKNEAYTNYDILVNDYIKEKILNTFKNDTFISEESKKIEGKSEFTWVLDPIDGTNNFMNSIPFFCISLALLKNNKYYAGIVHNPIINETFISYEDKAYFKKKFTKNIVKTPQLRKEDSLISYGISRSKLKEWQDIKKEWNKLAFGFQAIRNLGSAAIEISYVGLGRLGIYMIIGYNIWDIAGAILFAKNAGASYYINEEKSFLIVYNKNFENDVKNFLSNTGF